MSADKSKKKLVIYEPQETSLSPRQSPGADDSDEAQAESLSGSPVLAHERSDNTKVPVTPGIHLGAYRSAVSPVNKKSEEPGYFIPLPSHKNNDRRFSQAVHVDSPVVFATDDRAGAISPTDLVRGAMSDHEVLRRMSLSSKGQRESITDIQAAAPDLGLSGSIISATFSAPHKVTYRKGGEWELLARHGQSALFDAFQYLSSDDAPWNHTVVAWTGEIDSNNEPLSPPDTPPVTTSGIHSSNPLSAPVPLPGAAPPTPPASDGLWIPREHQLDLESRLLSDKRIKTIPVWLADDDDRNDDGIHLHDQNRWRRYAEHELYTLFHYKQHEPTNGTSERVEWADYYRMNMKFANRIVENYKPGDIVVVHDYQLMLLPLMLRQKIPNIYIAFFLHCPFPSSEFLRCLPRRKEVLEGVLGSNLVGFQSYSYSRHFSSCCTRILDFPSDTIGVDAYGARVEVGVFPIGIDASKVEKRAYTAEVDNKYDALKQLYEGKKIIVGRDRLDSVRGVTQKLMAFERFLELYPEWKEDVVLIQVTSPTSIEEEHDDTENRVGTRVNELVMKINGIHGGLDFTPVQHYPQYLDPDEYFALLRAADIGLITSVRDGMNTTSLEYVVCQRDTHGPLILSEFSGTAGSLRDAIHINPWDLTDVAKQIHHALTMSSEKRMMMQTSLHEHVTNHHVQSWITKFLRKLVGTLATTKNNIVTPLLDRTLMLEKYRSAGKRLFMFDYDGTLTPIVREPSAAIPTERVIHTLKSLAADHRNAVWIISGRDQEFLQQHLGHITEMGFSAEHGSFIRHPGESTWENLAETFDMSWQQEVIDIFQKYTDRAPGSFIERKRCALTWHYRQADVEQGVRESLSAHKELEATVTKKWDVDVMKGKANLEVRPTFINKGEIAKRLVHSYESGKPLVDAVPSSDETPIASEGKLGFVLCAGDDFTDEDMFRALNGIDESHLEPSQIFTTTVGASNKVTLAKYHLLEPEDVIESAALLAGVGKSGDAGEKLSQVNLAAVAGLDGHVPDI